MAYQIQQKDIDIIYQKKKELSIKIELLNESFKVVDIMQGSLISGDISIDANSDIRRVSSLTFVIKDKTYLVSELSKIWFDKKVRIKLGITYQRTKEIIYYDLGILVFNSANFTYDETNRTVSVNCNDLMCLLNGEMGGYKIGALDTTIPINSNIRNAMISTLQISNNINNYYIDNFDITVPYDLKFPTQVTQYDIISKLRDLKPSYETYFDTYGTFICKQIPTGINDIVVLDESIFKGIIISENSNTDLTSVKNLTEIWGMNNLHGICKEVSVQPTIEEINVDKTKYNCDNIDYVVNPDSPFTCDKIGERKQVLCGSDGGYDKIYTIELVLERARYENWKTTRLQDSVTLELFFIPFLEVNQKISYTSKVTGITEQYIIKRISTELLSGVMSMELIKFYPLYPF